MGNKLRAGFSVEVATERSVGDKMKPKLEWAGKPTMRTWATPFVDESVMDLKALGELAIRDEMTATELVAIMDFLHAVLMEARIRVSLSSDFMLTPSSE